MKWLGARASAALRVAALGAVIAMGACYSPTLPLPPPNDPTTFLVSDDRTSVTMEGTGAIPGALVFILNEDVGRGQFAVAGLRGDYHLTLPLDLSLHDQNWFMIWQHSGSRDSETHSFRAPPRYGPGSVGWSGGDGGDVPQGDTDAESPTDASVPDAGNDRN
jgi:hypothetical protein